MRNQADQGESRVRRVIDVAARRSLLVLAVEHSSFVLSAVCGGLVLLLLLGTQILAWQWQVVIGLLGLAAAYWRFRGRILSRYRISQIVDQRLALSDTLSTAWFLLHDVDRGKQSDFESAQLEQAESVARRVKPAAVFPFVWRRSWAIAGMLAVLAFGLFAVRYLVTSSLSFKQALIPLSFSFPAEVFERIERLAGHDSAATRRALLTANSSLPREASPKTGDQAAEESQATEETAARNGPGANDRKFARTPDDPGASAKPHADLESRGRNGNAEAGQNAGQDGKPPDQQARNEQPANDAKRESDQQPSSGLVDRMKDALSGLMAKTHSQDGARQEDRSQEPKPGEQQSAQNGSRKSQVDQQAQNSRDANARDSGQSAQGQQQAQASEKAPATQANSSDESTNRKGSDPQSGIGRQDGDKGLREAEQLRAMGKLDEIIGKRSATLTGEMTVETRSGNRPLETQYSGRVGQHADLGGEIDRDEVPLNLQRYVREYMEQVRKQAEQSGRN